MRDKELNCLIRTKLHEDWQRVRDFLCRRSQSVFPVLYGLSNHC
jgi:hypothetical protein